MELLSFGDTGWGDELLRATFMTILVAIAAFTFGFFISFLIVPLKLSKRKVLNINLAIKYGSKSEIVETIKKIIKKKQNISEKKITSNLYTSEIPDPEILIRTGNTKRLSNFLLWQLAYSEIFFEKKLWPDFKNEDLNKIMKKFKSIKRNFGNI